MGFTSLYPGLSTRPSITDQNILRPQSGTVQGLTVEVPNAFGIGQEIRSVGDTFPRLRLGASIAMGTGGAALQTALQRDLLQLHSSTDTQPRLKLDASNTRMSFGPGGSTAADVTLERDSAAKGLVLRTPPAHSGQFAGVTNHCLAIQGPGLLSSRNVADVGINGTDGGFCAMVRIWPTVAGSTNGTRGDSTTADTALSTLFSLQTALSCMNQDSGSAFDSKGGFIHFHSTIRIDPYYGGGSVYAEVQNIGAAQDIRRQGVFACNAEIRCEVKNTTTGGAGSGPARACMIRLVMEEDNAMSTYNSTNFGAGSRYITLGAMGMELISQGTQRAGTGIAIHGTDGWTNFLNFLDASLISQFSVSGTTGRAFARGGFGLTPVTATGIPNNTLFVDSTGNVLKFRDNAGTLRTVTVV